mmetsp:Transcript_35209/g.56281  ORF Transcript_35209/g.56281 Transcript_35209/m.56281 type:complete len:385 (-) Transcript_35209:167-1321(-)
MAFSQEREGVPRSCDCTAAIDDTQLEESRAIHATANADEGTTVREASNASLPREVSVPFSHHRLEQLIEQQNALLLKQVQLAEKTTERHVRVSCQRVTSQNFLDTLDPDMKSVFARWKQHFTTAVAMYVSQSRKYSKMEAVASKGELIKPFSRDAMHTWVWPEIYSSIAQPIQGIDFDNANGSSVSMGSSDISDTQADPGTYDVNRAFKDLRSKHAWESQTFVLRHQKTCVDRLLEGLSLECQIKTLQDQIAAWIFEQSQSYSPQAKQDLEVQARAFVEVVHRGEMQKAEQKLKEEFALPTSFCFFLRGLTLVLVFVAVATVSYELLVRVFAVLFVLGCGMALLWEDVLIHTVRFLLGQSLKRVEVFCAQASHFYMKLPITFWH